MIPAQKCRNYKKSLEVFLEIQGNKSCNKLQFKQAFMESACHAAVSSKIVLVLEC